MSTTLITACEYFFPFTSEAAQEIKDLRTPPMINAARDKPEFFKKPWSLLLCDHLELELHQNRHCCSFCTSDYLIVYTNRVVKSNCSQCSGAPIHAEKCNLKIVCFAIDIYVFSIGTCTKAADTLITINGKHFFFKKTIHKKYK